LTNVANPTPRHRPAHYRRVPRPSQAVSGHIGGLDGVRAFAVLAVLLFHLWPNRFPGGFLGVDVFFVISGFLITTLLLRERERDGRVDLLAFWKRRARRLLPALVTVVLISIAAAKVVSSDLLVGIERQTLGALTFSSNWLEVLAGSDYFDDTAPTLFVTFWSLAVEEQFYLIWPLAFVAVLALARSSANRAAVALGLAALSAVLMAIRFVPGSNPTRVYYGTDTHFFGLMIGAALAFAFAGDVGLLGQRRWQRLRQWTGFVALAGLVVMILGVDSDSAFTYQGGIVLASLLSAVVVAALPGAESPYTKVHRWRPLTWVGERSYGIYLWHWPAILIVAALLPPVAPGAGPSWATVAVSMGITFGLSALSYRWIEMPVRHQGFRGTFAACRASLAGLRDERRFVAPGPGIAAVSAAAVVVFAGVAIGTAPEKSAAQLAVEQGEQAMAAQAGDVAGSGPAGQAAAAQAQLLPPDAEPSAEPESAPRPAPAWPKRHEVPPGELVVGLGDSVLSGAAPALYERFPGILLDAEPIRQWREAPALVQQMLDAGTMRPVVVLSFGTNAGLESEESEQALRSVLDLLGPDRRIVLVNVVGVSGWVPSTNDKLAAISAEHPNTVVADWHSVIAADPSLVHSDRTHPNIEGIDVYAELVATSLRDLGPR
jgi:peptidoglycan/LPS O-acetylase OafA/YrhL